MVCNMAEGAPEFVSLPVGETWNSAAFKGPDKSRSAAARRPRGTGSGSGRILPEATEKTAGKRSDGWTACKASRIEPLRRRLRGLLDSFMQWSESAWKDFKRGAKLDALQMGVLLT